MMSASMRRCKIRSWVLVVTAPSNSGTCPMTKLPSQCLKGMMERCSPASGTTWTNKPSSRGLLIRQLNFGVQMIYKADLNNLSSMISQCTLLFGIPLTRVFSEVAVETRLLVFGTCVQATVWRESTRTRERCSRWISINTRISWLPHLQTTRSKCGTWEPPQTSLSWCYKTMHLQSEESNSHLTMPTS